MKNKKKITLQQVFAVATAITMLFVFAVCDNGTNNNGTKLDPKCECTNKDHVCDCNLPDCDCVELVKPHTHPMTFKEGALKFNVAYQKLPSATAPEYLGYIEERLGTMVNSGTLSNIAAVDFLLSKGNQFTINVEYTGDEFSGIVWDVATQKFRIHNDWISEASDIDLSLAMLRDAFNSVEITTARAPVPQLNRQVIAYGSDLVPVTTC